ncbi:DUF2294 domain-containing protein [Urbifossiella limnaea]|uniref:Na+-translocating membrane potential-generating system MpsC domain-containing protein n=1 Tax=Urbifossiella limnaea TaxID=2528023 RepID=A0A517Y1V3_9BACT|nr:DUF2294 domain-containing protein [Urbifossiella limnaea]QDU23698.1 hypothetical protein ETAA1_57040 [Urbifossiella limnaea]
MRTRGELEAEISAAVIRFKRDYMGRGPQEVRTFLVEDVALVRLRGVLTPAEQRLAQVEDPHRGRDLIKQLRVELIEHGRELLEQAVQRILGVRVLSLHTDISTRTGESVLVFSLSSDPVENDDRDLDRGRTGG